MSGLFSHSSLKTIVFSISTPHNIILWLCSSFSDILTHTFLYEVSWLINTYIFYIIGIWMSKDSLVLCSIEYLNSMWPVLPSELFSQVYFTLFSKHQSLFPIEPITFVSTNHVFCRQVYFTISTPPSTQFSTLWCQKGWRSTFSFSISLSLSLYFLMMITFGIVGCFAFADQSCKSYFDLYCIFLSDILHLQVPPRFHWYSKEHRSASGLFSLWQGSTRCKTFSKYFSKIVVSIS